MYINMRRATEKPVALLLYNRFLSSFEPEFVEYLTFGFFQCARWQELSQVQNADVICRNIVCYNAFNDFQQDIVAFYVWYNIIFIKNFVIAFPWFFVGRIVICIFN